MIKFSIIIPIYNIAPYLRVCLDSILTQKFDKWECLCVNDGSKDESGAILDEYARKDKRFRVFHKPNGGVSSARNLGLENAKGEWIWFVDGDDIIAKTALEKFISFIETNKPFDALLFDNLYFNDKTSPLIPSYNEQNLLHKKLSCDLYDKFMKGVWTILFKRSNIKSLRFKPYRLAEDSLFSLEYLFHTNTIFETNLKLYFYRKRLGSAFNRPPDVVHMRDWFNACKDILICIAKNKHQFQDKEFQKVIKHLFKLLYYTNSFKFFKMPLKDGKILLPMWLSNMKQITKLGHVTFRKRLIIFVLTVFKSMWLTKTLVTKPFRIRSKVK